MLEKSLGLMFFLKKPQDYVEGLVSIYLRITVDGVRKEMSTKRFWDPEKWNAKANRAIGNKEESKNLNTYLDVLQNKAYDARTHLIDRGKIVTALAIRNIISGEDQRQWMLLTLFKTHNNGLEAMIGKGVAKGTHTNFETSYKHVSKFLKSKYKVDDINILSLDLEFIKKLYNWFRTVKDLNHNSALKNIANMKKIVLDCVDNGWLVADPFAKFEMTRDEVDTVYLTKEQVQAIANKKITNPRLSRVRDLFIFSCFTGLSFIDMKQLKRSEVSTTNGELRIYKNRQKTGTPAVIPLLPMAKGILKKYEHDEYCIVKDMLLPVLSNQKYNSYLKELGDMCGVEIELSSKIARNTFGTTITLANNVPMETISKMMGHKSLRQTQHYAKVLAIKVTEDMANLNKRLTKIKFMADSPILNEEKPKMRIV
ncbi:site-specific integrase [Mucilaginibacter aquariorum]|uniref:Site-specific integrase n=1 Tax=Mucilaginibacter aquariorum TaxID=2967225 RepID=A0ABT1T033_9SPHI|nr:site-specific integrase [Mucilaginibacter aquariorum]MCQ6957338.1 site-specific integrase [Mucilaginibacter aquariorum]